MSIAGRLAALFLALAAITAHAAREFTDDSGRKVALPDRVTRVYAAGPPASVLVFALAPDTLIASLIDHVRNLLILRTCGPDSPWPP